MRRNPTRTEDRLWSWLRDRRCGGWKFRRQVPLGPYIVDFYCAALRLVIEADGTPHRDRDHADSEWSRTRDLEQRGLRVVRIANELLIRDSQLVGEIIHVAVEQQLRALENPPHPPSAPSPPRAGEKGLD